MQTTTSIVPTTYSSSCNHSKQHSNNNNVKHLCAGIFAGVIETIITMPFEVTKTRLQLQPTDLASNGMLSNMRQTIKLCGFRGLYYGLPVMIIQTGGKVGLRFVAYENFKRILSEESGNLSQIRLIIAGCAAGATEAVFWITPCDRLKTLRQKQIGLLKQRHTTLGSSLRLVLKDEGVVGLYRGLMPTFWRNSLSVGIRFSIYDKMMQILKTTNQGQSSWHFPLICGAAAGAFTTLLNNPIDVVKSVMQATEQEAEAHHKYYEKQTRSIMSSASREGGGGGGMLHHTRNLFQAEGISVFTRGLLPRLLKITIGQAVIFFTYEEILNFIKKI